MSSGAAEVLFRRSSNYSDHEMWIRIRAWVINITASRTQMPSGGGS